MALLLLEQEDEETSRVHMRRARDRTVDDRLLDYAVQADRRFRLGDLWRRHRSEGLGQHLVHLLSQQVDVHAAHRQHLLSVRFIGNGPQQVLE